MATFTSITTISSISARRSDLDIQRQLLDELKYEPAVSPAHIGVSAKNGILTLSGHVNSYAEKWAAEKAAKRVHGVRAVANEIDVRLPGTDERTFEDIAIDAVAALQSNRGVPHERIRVTVNQGWVELEGEVERQEQKEAAEASVRYNPGVKGVSNAILVRPRVAARELAATLGEALESSTLIDARRIRIDVNGSAVSLHGTVRSSEERDFAARLMWASPAVTHVDNHLTIAP